MKSGILWIIHSIKLINLNKFQNSPTLTQYDVLETANFNNENVALAQVILFSKKISILLKLNFCFKEKSS